MVNRQQIQQIPGALRTTLEKVRAEFGTVARKVRWGDGPVYVCGAGDCAGLGIAASYAFESLLGWPVAARPVEVFQTYALSLLRLRSVLVMIAAKGEWPEAVALAEAARKRGCTLVVLTNAADSPLVALADHVLLTPVEGDTASPDVTVCLHAALNLLAFEVALALKRAEPQWGLMTEEFNQLPDKLEWVFTQLPTVVRSAGTEVAAFPRLSIVGGGLFHFPAWQAARRLRSQSGLAVEAMEPSEFSSGPAGLARSGDAVLFLSGSHSKIKKLIHRCAAQIQAAGARVLSLTDSNDLELVERSNLGILVPSLQEGPASTLTMFMLEWLAMEAQRAVKQPPAR